ncbi:tripartite tricarboxylate transporter TctB family protein [Martelella mediterranea]|uniref:tripartite tricarboxylate transporter TctB family protein n=1 Tax=uncultured Martelella sp. TaxID=392331 RepID=UPI000D04A7A6|nr:tripartite tricarboxylate transporter TctB family protein [uncultured Martelella sp.]
MTETNQTNPTRQTITRGERIALVVIAIVLSIISVLAILETRNFPQIRLSADVGPGRFPVIFATILIALCIIMVVQAFRAELVAAETEDETPRYANVVLGVVITCICVAAINFVGYPIPAAILLFSLMWLMGRRNVVVNALIAIGLTAVIYVAFARGLMVPLPMGSFFE